MNTPNDTTDNTAPDAGEGRTDDLGADRKPGKGKGRRDRTQRAAFWLRTIELQKDRRAREYRKSLRDVAREGISDEEYAAMLATLEKMARNLGWDESQPDERPFGRGFGRRHGFGPGFGGHGHGFGPDHDHEGHGFRHGHRHPGMMRGFGRMHPADHHDHDGHTADRDVTTEAPKA